MRTSSLLIAATIMLSPTMALAQGASDVAHIIPSVIYGNTSNARPDGQPGVLPSLAPGPWACIRPGDCSAAKAGGSMGEFLSSYYDHGNAEFASGADKTTTNFLNKQK